MITAIASKNQKGQTLVGAIIGLAVAAAGMAAIMGYIEYGSKSVNNLKYRMDADNLNEEIRALLSSPAACTNSFGDLSSELSQKHDIAMLRDGTVSPGAERYVLGQIYGDQSLKLTSMTLANFSSGDIPTKAQGLLTLGIGSQKDGLGAKSVARSVVLSLDIDPTTKKIISCIAMAKMSDGIWRRGTASLNTAYFSGGNVGIGTDAPSHPLDIVTMDSMNRTVTATNYGTDPNPWGGAFLGSFSRGLPASRLAIKTDDSLAVFGGNGFDGSGFAPNREAPGMYVSASENWAPGQHGSILMLRTVNNGQDNATTKMLIDQNGSIGIGTINPQYTLDVNGNARATGSIAAWSDVRVKKNITPLENSLERILKIDGVSFEWRRDEFPDKKFKEGRDIGVIAQNVETQFPEVVETGTDGYKSVAYQKLVAPLIQAVKVLHRRISDVETENSRLKANGMVKDRKIRELETRLENIEKFLNR